MTEPQDCQTIAEVRSEIDRLDRSLITTISQRQEYVHAAVRFKSNQEQVHAKERQRLMMAARRLWAETEGVDPDMVEKIFRTMVDHFVNAELAIVSEAEHSQAGGRSSATTNESDADGSRDTGGR